MPGTCLVTALPPHSKFFFIEQHLLSLELRTGPLSTVGTIGRKYFSTPVRAVLASAGSPRMTALPFELDTPNLAHMLSVGGRVMWVDHAPELKEKGPKLKCSLCTLKPFDLFLTA